MVWSDGEFLEEENFKISPFDRGLCHGLSLFETLLAVDGRLCLLPEHLERMRQSLAGIGVTSIRLDDAQLREAMASLLHKNGLEKGHARLRFAVSFGVGALNHLDGGKPWSWMTAVAVSLEDRALRVMPAPWKHEKAGLLVGLKTGNYAAQIIAMDKARREGFDELLFYNHDGELCEAAMANVFLIHDDCLFTPSLESGCLPGIARAFVLHLASSHGIKCVEKILLENDVQSAYGIFLTSSVKGPVWVSEYAGRSYQPHPLFLSLRKSWHDKMADCE